MIGCWRSQRNRESFSNGPTTVYYSFKRLSVCVCTVCVLLYVSARTLSHALSEGSRTGLTYFILHTRKFKPLGTFGALIFMSEGIKGFIFGVKHNCYSCWETCYWHMIEERFCFDESIASYQEPITKEEKNNNLFDNMAFYDSVSVIAGRAVVTIDPMPEKKNQTIIEQPRRLKKEEKIRFKNSTTRPKSSSDSLNTVGEENVSDAERSSVHSKEEPHEKEEEAPKPGMKKTVSFGNILTKEDHLDDSGSKSDNSSSPTQVELRKKSLKERRMSKSLSLKIDYPQDMPIIRQSSVPKFFLDTPEENQTESSLIRTPLTALQSPMGDPDGFSFDLKSVVQIENSKKRRSNDAPGVHREASVSRLTHMKRSIKLRKSKSSASASSIPHTNYI